MRAFRFRHLPHAQPTRRSVQYLVAGSWYLDATAKRVYYALQAGESAATLQAIMPVLETIVLGQGDDSGVLEYIQFSDLTFAHGTWLRTSQVCRAVQSWRAHVCVCVCVSVDHCGDECVVRTTPGPIHRLWPER